MSENLDLVRSIYADWERGDFSSTESLHPEFEIVVRDGPERGSWKGLAEVGPRWGAFLAVWSEYRVEVESYRELDPERVLVLMRHVGRGKASGLGDAELSTSAANVMHVRDGRAERLDVYWDRDSALADLGVEE
jgi:ketosteroid isomerase-like protein